MRARALLSNARFRASIATASTLVVVISAVAGSGTPQHIVARARSLSAPGAPTAAAQPVAQTSGAPHGGSGATIIYPQLHALTKAARDLPRAPVDRNANNPNDNDGKPATPASLADQAQSPQRDPARQSQQPSTQMPATVMNFDGLSNNDNAALQSGGLHTPPDNDGAVGDTQYVEWINTTWAVYDKSTGAIAAGWPKNGNDLFAPLPGTGLCETTNKGDPLVQYDQLANRWVLSQFAFTSSTTPPFHQCIAVSTSSDATGSWNLYDYTISGTYFNDYGKLGIWPDGYYMSFNMFPTGSGFHSTDVAVFDRVSMIAGAVSPAMQLFDLNDGTGPEDPFAFTLLPSSLEGSTLPPANSPNFFMGDSSLSSNAVDEWKFHVDWTTPANTTFTGPTTIGVDAFDPLVCSDYSTNRTCLPQFGTPQKLDALSDRMLWRNVYRNFGDHESNYLSRTVNATTPTHPGQAGQRWMEIRDPNGTPGVFDQGTFAPADSVHRFGGSIAADQNGNIAMGYSATGSGIYPGIRYTGRLATDSAGTMQAEGTIIAGTGSKIVGTSGYSRWGDYSVMSVDPTDDCTFWYINQYFPSNSEWIWQTRIASFKFSSCGPSSGGPTNPTFGTPTPVTNTWTTDNTIDIPITAAGTGGSNALGGYSWMFTQNSSDDPDINQAESTGTATISSGALAQGVWYLRLRTLDTSNNSSAIVTVGPFRIDLSNPYASISNTGGVLSKFQRANSFPLVWSGTDGGLSGIANYDITYRAAMFNGVFGARALLIDNGAFTMANVTNATYGALFCFQAGATDNVGHVYVPAAGVDFQRCTAIPLHSAMLSRTAGAWGNGTGAGYFHGTFQYTVGYHASLSRSSMQARDVSVIATKCPNCGAFDVYFQRTGQPRTYLGHVNLNSASTTKNAQVFYKDLGSTWSGTMSIVTSTSGHTVRIEGFGSRRLP